MALNTTSSRASCTVATRLTSLFSFLVALTLILWTTHAAFAHEHRHVGEYELTVGFAVEPAIEGQMNGVSLSVVKVAGHDEAEEHEHAEGEEHEESEEAAEETPVAETAPVTDTTTVTDTATATDEEAGHEEEEAAEAEADHDHATDHAEEEANVPVPVEGLEETLQVEVTHIESNVSKVMALRAVYNDPGHYTNDWIPTAPGAYRFRFFGTIEGNEIDETFESGEGTFSEVESSADLYFPEPLPQMREVAGAARGAQEAANSALETVTQVESSVSSTNTVATVGLVAGVLGLLAGGVVLLSSRRR